MTLYLHPKRGAARPHALAATSVCWVLIATLAPAVASATLGQNSSTIQSDAVRLRAQVGAARPVAAKSAASASAAAAPAYTVHELQLPGGGQVREYVTSSNVVFAVGWNGPSIPELQQLLGAYFPRVHAAAKAIGRLRRGVDIEDQDLVVRTGGHMRAFFGIAYLPAMLPPGVTAKEIQ